MATNAEIYERHIPLDRVKDAENKKKDIVQCYLCKGLVWHPVECENCDTTFCLSCIERYHKNDPQKSCPNNCGKYEEKRDPPITMDSVRKLEIKCCYEPNGCTNIFSYNAFEEHEINCEYQLKRCDGCNQDITQKEFDQHCLNCQYIVISCEHCSTSYQQKDKSLHTDIACLRTQVQQLASKVQSQQELIEANNNLLQDFIRTTKDLNQLIPKV